MPLAEGVSALVRYKAYASGVINSTTEPLLASEPGASGGQALRRVGCTLDLSKNTFASAEIRSDKQIADLRHGSRRVSGDVTGELSPGTYKDFFAALTRGTWGAANIALSNTELTSAVCDNVAGTIIFGGGDPVALGITVGSVLVFTNMSAAGNNNINFVVTGMAGTSGRTLTVFPKPATMASDVAFNVVVKGAKIIVPSSGMISRKFAVEVYHEDLDLSRLFTELRVTSGQLSIPPDGMGTVGFGFMGRNMVVLEGASAPYLTGPTAETVTGVIAGSNGVLVVQGVQVGVLTGLEFSVDLSAEAEPVIGQNIVPEIFLGRFNLTGQMTAYFESATLMNLFLNETEATILAYVTAGGGAAAEAMTLLLPRVKYSGANLPTQGEGGQIITMPFQALKHAGATASGIPSTTFQLVDTAIT